MDNQEMMWSVTAEDNALFRRGSVALEGLSVELDGRMVRCAPESIMQLSTQTLSNGVEENIYRGPVRGEAGLMLTVVVRHSADSPVLRFRYVLHSDRQRIMTKTGGTDRLDYVSTHLTGLPRVTEVRLSDFVEMVHSYCLSEREVTDSAFANELGVMGPLLLAGDGKQTVLLAYEHGSQVPTEFVEFKLTKHRSVTLAAAKGNYATGRVIDSEHPFETIWLEAAVVDGDIDHMAKAYRTFVLKHMSVNTESRKPYLYYNTWNFQERNKHWNGRPYLESMNEARILAEIDIAHRMGLEVYVIDTGWYEKTGDWRVNETRFPGRMKAVRDKLEGYGMKLGLWFDNAAALSSRARLNHEECVISWRGERAEPQLIWEGEAAQRMCLVSRYADGLADEWIRLARELGVRYFKWDAIQQYGCDDPHHNHGSTSNDAQERADCYAFELGRSMIRIVERLTAAIPDAIVDFDITEAGRFVGLGFLSVGKFFLINNGPYYHNYDVKIPPEINPNLFFFPGLARTWICRTPLTFDRWIPSTLFLTHYLPDDPEHLQTVAVASLILGQNGIWGDLLSITDAGITHIAHLLGLYKQVRDQITNAAPISSGRPGASPEIYEKIDDVNGKGCVCLFITAPGTYQYVTAHRVDKRVEVTEGCRVDFDEAGRAKITLQLDKPGAAIAFFGAEPQVRAHH